MVLSLFLPTMFFVFDMLVYFIAGYMGFGTIMNFFLYSLFNRTITQTARILALLYCLIQVSVFYNTIIITSILSMIFAIFLFNISFFIAIPFFFQVVIIAISVLGHTFVIEWGIFGTLESYTIGLIFGRIIVTVLELLFLKSIYVISGQSNRLSKIRGKSGHQTGNVPFDKIRTGNKYC